MISRDLLHFAALCILGAIFQELKVIKNSDGVRPPLGPQVDYRVWP